VTQPLRFALYLYLAITAIAIFLPLSPRMPAAGLDYSWHLGDNQAVAQHLRFGKQIMFTYGPYAAICDRSYHPATEARMFWGSLLIGFAYCSALLYLAQKRNQKRNLNLLLFFALFLSTFAYPDLELLLLSLPFLLVVCGVDLFCAKAPAGLRSLPWWKLSILAIDLCALGLLPLVKDSLLVPVAASLVILGVLAFLRDNSRISLGLLLLPVASLLAFWVIGGQHLADLPAFLREASLLTSGYTEAQAASWGPVPPVIGLALVLSFLALAALVFTALIRSSLLTPLSRWTLLFLCAVYLLIAFKLGFVRSDHVWSAFACPVVFVLLISFAYPIRMLRWTLGVTMLFVVALSILKGDPDLTKEVLGKFKGSPTVHAVPRNQAIAFAAHALAVEFSRATYLSTLHTYSEAWHGLAARTGLAESLPSRYEHALAKIRTEHPIPAMPGTSDIYTYDQSILIASHNHWNPRLVLQSYSAYTPLLPMLDEQHLRGTDAPDWVVFNVQTTDHRYPSLDDGLSWPALMDNYTLRSFDGTYAYLQEKPSLRPATTFAAASTQTATMGQPIALRPADRPLFAEITATPTLLGQLAIILFKPPQLHLTVTLRNGETQTYRVNANMMTTGFVLSPLVKTTQDFAQLESGSYDRLAPQAVTSLTLAPSFGGPLLWKKSFHLTLKQY
jgi:hypothetical protein